MIFPHYWNSFYSKKITCFFCILNIFPYLPTKIKTKYSSFSIFISYIKHLYWITVKYFQAGCPIIRHYLKLSFAIELELLWGVINILSFYEYLWGRNILSQLRLNMNWSWFLNTLKDFSTLKGTSLWERQL